MSTTNAFTQFDKAACVKKLDEVGKAVIAYKFRPGYDVDAWLKANVLPLDARLNVKHEKSKELQDAILALPLVPTKTSGEVKPTPAPATKPVEPVKATAPTVTQKK